MKCCQCGKTIDGNSRFCEFCGARQGYSEQLIQDAIYGREPAIRELYNRTYGSVYRMVKSMIKDEDAALNLIQDAYILGFHNLHRLKNPGDYEKWIVRITQNKMAGYLRKKKPDTYGNITGEDVERIITYSNEKTQDLGDLKPNQRLLELIENECVYENAPEETGRPHSDRKRSDGASSAGSASGGNPSGQKKHEAKTSGTPVILKIALVLMLLAFGMGAVAALIPRGGGQEDVLTPNPTPSPEAVATPTPILQGSSLATPTPRPTAVPTATPVPTEAPMPTAVPMPTATPIPMATPTPGVIQEPVQTWPEEYSSGEVTPEEEPLFEETIVHEQTFYTE
ncbi:MAG: sigma factor [Blautia sp.]|nr:sigma factor [Blautia sp.]